MNEAFIIQMLCDGDLRLFHSKSDPFYGSLQNNYIVAKNGRVVFKSNQEKTHVSA